MTAGFPHVPGHRLGRELRRDRGAVVHEAVQLGLGRSVAVELIHGAGAEAEAALEAARRQGALRHPAVVAVFDAGRWEGGAYVVRRLPAGSDLASLTASRRLSARAVRRVLEDVRSGLASAHEAGLAHGALTARDVVVEPGGRACLTRLVLAEPGAVADDLQALQALRALSGGQPGRWGAGRRPLLAATATVLVAGVALATSAIDDDDEPSPLPPVARGATAVGSGLAPGGDVATVGCEGTAPGPSSGACTLVPALRPVRARGVVRAWAVRGAQGVLALQVVRPAGPGRWREVRRSQYVRVDSAAPVAWPADLRVEPGDRVAVELTPGAGIGVRDGRGGEILRFAGPLETIRSPRTPSSRLPPGELLLRADVVRGARPRLTPGTLLGPAAARAPAGRELASVDVELRNGSVVTVRLARIGHTVVLDLGVGARRRARLPLPAVRPEGYLFDALETGFTSATLVRVRWRNPGAGPPLVHDVIVGRETLRRVT